MSPYAFSCVCTCKTANYPYCLFTGVLFFFRCIPPSSPHSSSIPLLFSPLIMRSFRWKYSATPCVKHPTPWCVSDLLYYCIRPLLLLYWASLTILMPSLCSEPWSLMSLLLLHYLSYHMISIYMCLFYYCIVGLIYYRIKPNLFIVPYDIHPHVCVHATCQVTHTHTCTRVSRTHARTHARARARTHAQMK